MTLVNTSLNEFKQGQDPYKTMGLGYPAQVKAWFDMWAPTADYKLVGKEIMVDGDLEFYSQNISELLDHMSIDGELIIINCPEFTKLPNQLTVQRLDLSDNRKINSLPNDLKCYGDIILSSSGITSLNDNMVITGDLMLIDTNITRLPKNLKVEGDLDLQSTIFQTWQELPDDLVVYGTLYLSQKKPKNIRYVEIDYYK
jgi:hypothetical protein